MEQKFHASEVNELGEIKPNVCVYCGMLADSTDHVIPRKMRQMLSDVGGWRKRYPRITNTVWACRQCNSTAGDRVFDTIAQKRRYIHARYKEKHRKLINMPDWTDSELAQLGPEMRQYVITSLAQAELWRRRIAWPRVYE